jgi:hypothetical protein
MNHSDIVSFRWELWGEREREGILREGQCAVLKNGFQVRDHIHLSCFEGVQH